MARRAQCIDERPVGVEHRRKSVRHERTFITDSSDRQTLKQLLRALSIGVAGLR